MRQIYFTLISLLLLTASGCVDRYEDSKELGDLLVKSRGTVEFAAGNTKRVTDVKWMFRVDRPGWRNDATVNISWISEDPLIWIERVGNYVIFPADEHILILTPDNRQIKFRPEMSRECKKGERVDCENYNFEEFILDGEIWLFVCTDFINGQIWVRVIASDDQGLSFYIADEYIENDKPSLLDQDSLQKGPDTIQ